MREIWRDFKGLIAMAVATGVGYVAYLLGVTAWVSAVIGIIVLASAYAVFKD